MSAPPSHHFLRFVRFKLFITFAPSKRCERACPRTVVLQRGPLTRRWITEREADTRSAKLQPRCLHKQQMLQTRGTTTRAFVCVLADVLRTTAWQELSPNSMARSYGTVPDLMILLSC